MKLYLSSFRLGSQPEKLLELLGDGRKVAMVGNAWDAQDVAMRQKSMSDEIQRLESIGLQADELDLREYFNKETQDDLKKYILQYDLLWMRGGNAFVLRRALKYSGLDKILPDMLTSEQIVFGGYSADIDMLIPSLHGAELVDDPYTVPDEYPSKEIVWNCLGILPHAFAPHYKSNHPESADIDTMIQYMLDNHVPFVALRDGEVMIIDGDKKEVLA